MSRKDIPSGNTICILGAGQLGKMSLIAAHQLGYRTMVWAPDSSEGTLDPAMEMATYRLRRPFSDKITIDEVLRTAAVVTTEWENIPLKLIEEFERRGAYVRPGKRVLEIAQSRRREKDLAAKLAIRTTMWIALQKGELSSDTNWEIYFPGILKTDKLGYDGRGQWPVSTFEELRAAFAKADVDCILEKRVELSTEISVLVARTKTGNIKVSDVVENSHKDGILDVTVWPCTQQKKSPVLLNSIVAKAQAAAIAVAETLRLQGILVLEFFVDIEDNVLFNEMAPRPHNSFHGSIEAAYTSQFEQHIRAICGLPLGEVRFHTPFLMRNLIGGQWDDWQQHFLEPSTRPHLYGKAESRPGRKMGHVTALLPRP